MRRRHITLLVLIIGVISVTIGCSRIEPYVFKADEFNRDSSTFAKEPTDIETVTICYNKYGTTPGDLLEMAQSRCGDFSKTARFNHQDRLTCPLLTPVGAHFDCVKP